MNELAFAKPDPAPEGRDLYTLPDVLLIAIPSPVDDQPL